MHHSKCALAVLVVLLVVPAASWLWAKDADKPDGRHTTASARDSDHAAHTPDAAHGSSAPSAGEHGHGRHHGEPEEEGLLTLSADLGIWTLVVFVLLLVILKRLAWKPMLEGLHKREETIRSALEEAQKARAEAEQLRARLQQEMDRAAETVRGILEEARRDAQYTSEQILAKARQEIATERERLQREVAIAKDQALQELWNQAADLATLISAKAIRRSLSPEDHRRLMDEALAELRQVAGTYSNDFSRAM